jgi:hypothetical protein
MNSEQKLKAQQAVSKITNLLEDHVDMFTGEVAVHHEDLLSWMKSIESLMDTIMDMENESKEER